MSYNLLVVDDSSVVRAMVIKAVRMSGLPIGTILEAENGRRAIELLENNWVDVVFADLHMPEMSGMEMVAKMAESNLMESIPVVIVSSDQSQTRIEDLRKKGIRGYIRKPFRPEQFRQITQELLSDGKTKPTGSA